MDKYEFKLSLEEINKLIQQRRFDEAADIADGIDWNHVGNADTLRRVSEVYKAVGDYDRSRSVMAIARKRQPDNPAIIYSLCELTIFLYGRDGLQDDLTDSLQMMQEYQMLQPENPKRLILQYKMYGVSGASISEKIMVLEQLKKENPTARWGYELAKCYAEAGEQAKAAEMAEEVIGIFGGKYGERARQLAQSLEVPSGSTAAAGGGDAADRRPMREDRPARPEPEQEPARAADRGAAEEAIGPAAGDQTSEEGEYVRTWERAPREEQPSQSSEREEPAWQAQESPAADGAPGAQTGRQASIDEVMAEWEKIRSDIRRANDEKRAQRILEDTGSLLNSFDETARHGLLEDIEKGVARQRRQVRSGAYRVSRDVYNDAGRESDGEAVRDRYDRDTYPREEEPVRRSDVRDGYREYDGDEESYGVRRADRYEEAYDERRIDRSEEAYGDRPDDRYAQPQDDRRLRRYEEEVYEDRPDDRYAQPQDDRRPQRYEEKTYEDRPRREDEAYEDRSAAAVPVSNEDDDVRIYSGTNHADDAETRRWNSEEVHRSAMRRPQYREDARGRKRIVMTDEPEEMPAEPEAGNTEPAFEEVRPVRRRPVQEEEDKSQSAPEEEFEETVRRVPAPEAEPTLQQEEPEDTYMDEPEEALPPESVPAEEPEEEPAPVPRRIRRAAADREPEDLLQSPRRSADEEQDLPAGPDRESPAEEEPEEPEEPMPMVSRPRRGRVRRMSAGEQPYGPQDEEPVRPETPEPAQEPAAPPRRRVVSKQMEPAQEPEQEASAAAEGEQGTPSGRRELTREERRLFGPFCRMTENVNQLTEALEQISLASSTGNLLILGNEATADRVARGILEIIRHSDANFTGRIARATGESLNKLDAKGFSRTFAKLESGALIVTKAADIAPKTLERLHAELEREHGVILILTDGNKRMEVFRKENGQYLESFTAVINIRPLDDKALVAYARDYAQSQDYTIDEFGQLALAQRISSMQTPTHHVTLKEVRDLVDEAIGYASKKGPGAMMDALSRKRRDADGRVILHEKDFTHY